MTPLEKFIDESQRICENADNFAFFAHARTALPAALQHLRAATETIDGMRAQVGHLMAQCSEKDAHSALLSRRVAELEQRIADLHDEARNPPTLRTVCEKEPRP